MILNNGCLKSEQTYLSIIFIFNLVPTSCLLPERIRLLRVVPGSLDDYGHDDVIIIDEKKELLLASRKRSRQSKNESLNLFLRKKHFFYKVTFFNIKLLSNRVNKHVPILNIFSNDLDYDEM